MTERDRWKREEQGFYALHSVMTNPGRHAASLSEMPRNIDALQQIAHGLVIHFRLDNPIAVGIPEDRLSETENRYAETILDRLCELDRRPLDEHREPKHRVVGCCRDFTVVFLAMARSAGMSARARVGFATYFFRGTKNDHMVAEVWDEQDCRWRLVDPQLKPGHVDPNDDATFDPADVPRDRFLTAGVAWRMCKSGEGDPGTFVVRPDIELEVTRGWPYISHNLVFDLAALNRMELLLWDLWGLASKALYGKPLSPDEEGLLEQVADVIGGPAPSFVDLRSLYENNPLLRVPDKVLSISPTVPGPREVVLQEYQPYVP